MRTALPAAPLTSHRAGMELLFQLIAGFVSVIGVYLAWLLYVRDAEYIRRIAERPAGATLHRFWFSGWAFDWLYDKIFVVPFVWIARINRRDVFDFLYTWIAAGTTALHRLLRLTQNGRIRWYAAGITAGTLVVVAIMVLL